MTMPTYLKKYPHLFTPLEIPINAGKHKLVLKNRILQAPMATSSADINGTPIPEAMRFYTDFAKGGFALVAIPSEVPFWDMHTRVIGLKDDNDTHLDFHKPMKVIKAYGARAQIELVNGGSAYSIPLKGENAVTVSPIEVSDGVFTKEMTEEYMLELVEEFGKAALISRRAGFESISLGAASGALIQNFLSPRFNHRTDKYGGSIENCLRFPIMLLKKIREMAGDEIAIQMRISGRDDVYDKESPGLTPQLTAEYIKGLQDYVDYFEIWTGHRTNPANRPTIYPTNFMPEAMYADDLREIRACLGNELKVPLGLVGKIHTAELAEKLIAEGTADFICIGRQAIADPDFVKKIMEDREEDIRPCVHCNMCVDGNRRDALNDKMLTTVSTATFDLTCRVNPLYNNGHARKDEIPAPRHKEKVAIIGGGIAGMQAALAAAERGHQVTLYEKGSELGGQLNLFADKLWFTKDLVRLKEYFKVQLGKNDVTVMLNTEATPEKISDANYDSVIVAIGSDPIIPPISGIDGDNVSLVVSCFGNEANYGEKVVIIGGGLSACDGAIYLAENGHTVTVVEMSPYIAAAGVIATRQDIIRQFAQKGITSYTKTRCIKITNEGIYAVNGDGEEIFLPADNVLIATGNRPCDKEADAYFGTAANVRKVGDCMKASDLLNCIHSGFDAGWVIGV